MKPEEIGDACRMVASKEFEKLTVKEQIAYLVRAIQELEELKAALRNRVNEPEE